MADVTEQPHDVSAAEKNRLYCAAYYRLNRDSILDKVKHYSLDKKAEIKIMKAFYYQRNKKRLKEKNRADYQNRKDKSIAAIIWDILSIYNIYI